jgi:hypothetical protein
MAALSAVIIARRASRNKNSSNHHDYLHRRKTVKSTQGGTRPDLMISLEHRRPPTEDWIDVTTAHDSKKAMLPKSIKKFREEQKISIPRFENEPSPAVKDAITLKITKFAPLAAAAHELFEKNLRLASPNTVPFVVSSRGELSPHAYRLLRSMRMAHLESLPRGPPADGISDTRRSGEIRAKLEFSFLNLNAIGIGRILSSASNVSWNLH